MIDNAERVAESIEGRDYDDFIRADGPDDIAQFLLRPRPNEARLTISRTGEEVVAEVWTSKTGIEVTIAAFVNADYAIAALPTLTTLALQLIDGTQHHG